MKEFWEAKRYESLGLLSQNLRDQAERLEKSLRRSQSSEREEFADPSTSSEANISDESQAGINMGESTTLLLDSNLLNPEETVSDLQEYVNLLTTTQQYLHMSSSAQTPGDTEQSLTGKTMEACRAAFQATVLFTIHLRSNGAGAKKTDGRAIVISFSNVMDAYKRL